MIEWILILPMKLANRLVFKYLIGPAAKVLNDNQIKSNLFEFLVLNSRCSMTMEVSRFVQIGIVCSISEWCIHNYTRIKNNHLEAQCKENEIRNETDSVGFVNEEVGDSIGKDFVEIAHVLDEKE